MSPRHRAYADRFCEWVAASDCPVEVALGSLFSRLAVELGVRVPDSAQLDLADAPGLPPVHPDEATPDLLGQVREGLLAPADRHARGLVYTPRDLAEGLSMRAIEAALADGRRVQEILVVDPAAGGGAFALAALRTLARLGSGKSRAAMHQVHAYDIDPLSVAVAEAAIILEAGVVPESGHVAVRDLFGPVDDITGHFDLVLGNPPFQNQLETESARSRDDTAYLRARLGRAVTGYADTSTVFVAAAWPLVRRGGRLTFILPQSFLAARDARWARQRLVDEGSIEALWVATDRVFEASVRVCAPLVRKDAEPDASNRSAMTSITIARAKGGEIEEQRPLKVDREQLRRLATWSPLVADVLGVPPIELDPDTGRLGSFCRATAGFRDQYYGLGPYVVEAADLPGGLPALSELVQRGRAARLVTSGLINPLRDAWGTKSAKFGRRSWLRPCVDLDALENGTGLDTDGRVAQWGRARLVPKLVVATQTRVVEAIIDRDGSWWPSVPTIALTCAPDRLDAVAAVVHAPPVSVWALTHHSGAALSAGAIKLASHQVLDIPLPADRSAWAEGASLVREVESAAGPDASLAALRRLGSVMCEAYGASTDLVDWWYERLPRR